MKTINKIAEIFCICANVSDDCNKDCPNSEDGCNNMRCSDWRGYKAVKQAIELAQEWISVKDELPEPAKQVLTKVKLKTKTGLDVEVFSLGDYSDFSKKWSIIHSLIMNGYHAKSWEVTHWRQIELI